MQEYLHRLVRLRARAPDVVEKTIIEAAIAGLSLGPCGQYLERRNPKTLNRLFEIMQEYCISDKGMRRRIEEMNEKRSLLGILTRLRINPQAHRYRCSFHP